MASLHPKRESPSYSRGEYSGGIVLNHLFYDLDSRTSRWLFPDSRQSVLHTLPLTNTDRSYEFRSSSRADTNRVLGLLYLVVGDDTNEDGDLDGEDDFRIAVSSPEGTGYTTLIESAEVFHGAFRVDDAHTLLVWEKDETLRGTEVNLPGRTVTRETPLPSPPESNP